MRVAMLAAAATTLAVAASIATGGCSSTSSTTTGSVGGDPVCTAADAASCPTGAGVLQLCVSGQGSVCTGAYMKVGSQTFACNSCEDTAGCNEQASAVCYGDAGTD